MRPVSKCLLILIALWFIFQVARFLLLFPWSPERLIVSDGLEYSDVIVFLDGEFYERISHAFRLAESGWAARIFTAGVSYDQSEELLADKIRESVETIEFFRGEGASSTFEEARASRDFMRRHNLKSMILVTSGYHSFRASWVFRRVIPGVKIISSPVPVPDHELDPVTGKIKSDSRLYRYLHYEQKKFAAYYLMYGLFPWYRILPGI